MAWEWSHTPDAYTDAREQVEHLTKTELLVILREWAYHDRDKTNTLRTRTGAKRIAGFRLPNGVLGMHQEALAGRVWARAEQLATCDNGGWNCWVCPDGCHTVPFEPVKGGNNQ